MRILPAPVQWGNLRATPLGKQYPRTVSVSGTGGLPAEVELPSPLTLLFGLNGVGKTRLLAELAGSLERGRLVSIHALANYLINDFGKRADIDGLLEETAPIEISGSHLSSLSDLIRRDYEEVRWYAVPIVESPFAEIVGEEVVPVFTARYGGIDYDFRSMGLGELSAHLIMWILAYTRGENDDPLLFDEPEAFLPPPSRGVVLAHLLESVIRRKAPIVVASHSLELIQVALDAGSAILMVESSNGISLKGPSATDLDEMVAGIFDRLTAAEWLILSEDECAYILTEELLRAASPRVWQSAKYLWCKGYGDLEKIWQHLPRPPRIPAGLLNFAFVADGDKSEAVAAAVAEAKKESAKRWPFFCLPGDPDELMKGASEKQTEFIAEGLGVPPARLSGILTQLRGREPHNWVEDLLSTTGADRQFGLRILARAVVRDLSVAGVQAFADLLREHRIFAGK